MKKEVFLFSVLAIFFSAFPARSEARQASAWKGKIEKKDGVTIVSNPQSPIYQENVFGLEEDLVIRNTGGGKEYDFFRAWYIAVDDDGTIYVMDEGDGCVKVYDGKGKYLRRIGKKGQGPGELKSPDTIHLLSNHQLVFDDYIRGLNYFAEDGTFIRFRPTSGFINVLIAPDGRIIARANTTKSDQKGKEIRVYDGELKLLKTLLFLPDEPRDPQVLRPFVAGFYWALAQGDRVALAFKPEYEIEVRDFQGTSTTLIRRAGDRVKITQEEIDERKAKLRGRPLDVPAVHAAVQDIQVDDEGRIYAKTFEKTKDGASCYYDVFDRDGRYLVKAPIPANINPRTWKKGKMYGLEEDAEGNQKVKRYRVVWKIPG